MSLKDKDPLVELNDQEIVRRNKLQQLIQESKNPYEVEKSVASISIPNLLEIHRDHTKEFLQENTHTYTCHGRCVLIRQTFFVISEEHESLQCYINLKQSEESLVNYFNKYLDIGDIVEVKGTLFFTMKNELTLKITDLKIISKCLRPLPDKHSGLKDKDLLIRERIASLIANKEQYQTFLLRSKILFCIRELLQKRGYIEVETPTLQKIAGGALAKPFSTYYNSLGETFFLRIAPELALKKIITAGYPKIYEIGKSFRNEGIDATHNPEFTSIEIYTAYCGLSESIELTECIFRHVADSLQKHQLSWYNHNIDLSQPFKKNSLSELVKSKVGIDFYRDSISFENALALCKKLNIQLLEHEKSVGHILHKIFEELVEPTLIEPTFVYGYHKDLSPLAKADPHNPSFTLRFELFVAGKEFANGFAELNDPIDQLARFEAQLKEKESGNQEAGDVDYDYIRNIEYGLPPTGGLGIGLDRLIMLFTEKHSIRDVVFFPQVKSL